MFAGLAYCFHDDVCICLFAVVTVYLLCLLCLQRLLFCVFVFAVFCRVFIIRCVAQIRVYKKWELWKRITPAEVHGTHWLQGCWGALMHGQRRIWYQIQPIVAVCCNCCVCHVILRLQCYIAVFVVFAIKCHFIGTVLRSCNWDFNEVIYTTQI